MNAQSLPVIITDKALAEITHIIKTKNIPPDYGLRIGINGGGCSGVSYMLGFDKIRPNDDVFVETGFPVYMDKKHMMFLIGLIVDFEENADERGFVFNNPQ